LIHRDDVARRAFILEHTATIRAPLVPEFQLHLATEITPLWQATENSLSQIGLPPPYWAFAWVGGQAVARHILDHPELVAGRTVLDFAAGCGLISLAAIRAGAKAVTAVDIDPFAQTAIALNLALNAADPNERVRMSAEDMVGHLLPGVDVVLAGDVCYERPMAEAVILWLRTLARAGLTVIIGDPGRSYLPCSGLTALARYVVPTVADVEDSATKATTVWRVEAG
jgi:predicted nicotinamide N-methyase